MDRHAEERLDTFALADVGYWKRIRVEKADAHPRLSETARIANTKHSSRRRRGKMNDGRERHTPPGAAQRHRCFGNLDLYVVTEPIKNRPEN